MTTVAELDRRGWTTKRWTTKKGHERGGRMFDRANLYGLLTNVVYVGKVCYRDEIYEGEHPGIVDPTLFKNVRDQLDSNRRNGGAEARNVCGALLRGLIRCVPCGCAMTHTHTTRDNKRYRYYVCLQAQKRGWQTCPSKSIPAGEIEKHVIDQIRAIGLNPTLIAETVRQTQSGVQITLTELDSERRLIEQDLATQDTEMRRLAISTLAPTPDSSSVKRLADLQEHIRLGEQRLTEIREETIRLRASQIEEDEVAASLREFDPLWTTFSPREKGRILQLVIDHIDYDGAEGTVAITFRPTGIKALEQETQTHEVVA